MPDSILRRVAEGDRAAVGDCIARHGGLVWGLARRLSAGVADAEDAVQEIFLDLWAHAGRYDPAVASESTFVAMIARRRLIDRRRKQGRRPAPSPLPEGLAGVDDGPAGVDRSDEAARAAAALDSLREEQRRVLILAIYRGQTYAQIAAATGLPVGTVKTHARRGLIRLRELLDAPATSRSPGVES